MEDDHIESGGGVGDEVAEHVHLCNRVDFSEKTTSSQPLQLIFQLPSIDCMS